MLLLDDPFSSQPIGLAQETSRPVSKLHKSNTSMTMQWKDNEQSARRGPGPSARFAHNQDHDHSHKATRRVSTTPLSLSSSSL